VNPVHIKRTIGNVVRDDGSPIFNFIVKKQKVIDSNFKKILKTEPSEDTSQARHKKKVAIDIYMLKQTMETENNPKQDSDFFISDNSPQVRLRSRLSNTL